MKQTLTKGQYLTIASMLFGLFFGAGNLIFPVSMGQMSGHNIWFAIAGFLITSCSETFSGLFPKVLSYKKWTVLFCTVSFLIANLGLQSIIGLGWICPAILGFLTGFFIYRLKARQS